MESGDSCRPLRTTQALCSGRGPMGNTTGCNPHYSAHTRPPRTSIIFDVRKYSQHRKRAREGGEAKLKR